MEQRAFGPSGLKLSLVGLGTNNFGGRIDLEASRKVIHRALDLGITHFDTADVYGNSGGSEEIIGKVLGPRRSEVVLATKFGAQMAGSSETHRGRRDYVVAAVEASLRRLQTDRIDLLFMHRPDASTPIEETLRASAICATPARSASSPRRTFPPPSLWMRTLAPNGSVCRASPARRTNTA